MEVAFPALAILCGIVFIIAIAVVILRLIDRFTIGRPATPAERAAAEKHFCERLLAPRWHEVQQRFRIPIPTVLREFYADHDRLLQTRFYVIPPQDKDNRDFFVQRFEPADLQMLNEVWLPMEGRRFPFASDDFGNYFFVELADDASGQLPVFFIDHDGGDVSKVADSFAEFTRWKTSPA
jgi:hypothetical protein